MPQQPEQDDWVPKLPPKVPSMVPLRRAKREVRQLEEEGGLSAGQVLVGVLRNIVRAACVVMIVFGLIGLFLPFHPRFLTDNAMGASANAAECLTTTVRAGVFIVVGLGFFVLFRKPRDQT